MKRALVLLGGTLLLVLAPSPAFAGTLTRDYPSYRVDGTVESLPVLDYKAPEGGNPAEVNAARLGLFGTTAIVQDAAGIAAPLPAGCTYNNPRLLNKSVACTLPKPVHSELGKKPRFYVFSGDGDDVIRLIGAAGRVLGGSGADTVYGGDFDDTFVEDQLAGQGDTYRGGGGSDTADYFLHPGRVRVSLDGRRNDGAKGENDLVSSSVERVNGSSDGATLIGNGARNLLYGYGQRDVFAGGRGRDTINAAHSSRALISAGAGNDQIVGSRGRDLISLGTGADVAAAGRGNDRVRARDGRRDRVSCGRGDSDRVRADAKDRLRGCESVRLR